MSWYRVACWGRLAEVTNQYLAKGRKVMVIASRLEAEAYLDREGNPRAALKVTADAVKFLDGNGTNQQAALDAELDTVCPSQRKQVSSERQGVKGDQVRNVARVHQLVPGVHLPGVKDEVTPLRDEAPG